MAQYLKQYGEKLVELGYRVVPLPPGSKGPNRKGWPQFNPDVEQIRKWCSNGSSEDGAGIIASNTPAIDVDVLDPVVAQQMSDVIDSILGLGLLSRTGMAPKFLVPCRSDTPFKKLSSATYSDGKKHHKVEILGDGQQWVAYHTHPVTGKPFTWFDGVSDAGIAEVPWARLPLLTSENAQKIVNEFTKIAESLVLEGKWRRVTHEITPSSCPTDNPFAPYKKPVPNIDAQTILKLLNKLDVDSREDWVRAGRILHHQFSGDDEGLHIWTEWSEKSTKYDSDNQLVVWSSFGHRNDSPETMRSLIKEFSITPPTPQDTSFKFYPGDDYALDFSNSPEVIEDVLPATGIAMLYGPSGKGKTFWALDIAFHIHNGIPWRNKDVKKGDVMYVAAEAGRGIKKRIAAIKAIHTDWQAPFIADIAPNLSSIASIEAVSAASKLAGTPSVVVIDTMSASFEGDDSSQQDVAKMMRNLKILSDDLQCLVVFVHHANKDGASWRGSGVLFADVDAVLELIAEGEGDNAKQWVTQRKHRDGESGKSYPFSLKVSEPLAYKDNGKPINSCTVEQEDYEPVKTIINKAKSDNFTTDDRFAKARHYLSILQQELGLGNTNMSEDDVIEAIQGDETVNPLCEPHYPKASNIKRTLLTLSEHGKIKKEGRWIRLCE